MIFLFTQNQPKPAHSRVCALSCAAVKFPAGKVYSDLSPPKIQHPSVVLPSFYYWLSEGLTGDNLWAFTGNLLLDYSEYLTLQSGNAYLSPLGWMKHFSIKSSTKKVVPRKKRNQRIEKQPVYQQIPQTAPEDLDISRWVLRLQSLNVQAVLLCQSWTHKRGSRSSFLQTETVRHAIVPYLRQASDS